MHKVLRTFTAGRGKLKVGAIVDGSLYRNLGFLMRKGYLIEVDDVTPDEDPYLPQRKPAEPIVEEVIDETESAEDAEEAIEQVELEEIDLEDLETADATIEETGDPLEDVAAIDVQSAEPTKPAPKKSRNRS